VELVPKLLSGDPLLIDFLNSARKNAVSSYSLFRMRVVRVPFLLSTFLGPLNSLYLPSW